MCASNLRFGLRLNPDCGIRALPCVVLATRAAIEPRLWHLFHIVQFNSIQFISSNISYYNDNVHIMCRKRGGQKTAYERPHPTMNVYMFIIVK